MGDLEKLDYLKLAVGATDSEEDLLRFYLDSAEQAILNRLYPMGVGDLPEMPNRYDHRQIEIAIYLYNKRGAEGQTAHSENGIARSYESSSIPQSMLKDIVPYGRVL